MHAATNAATPPTACTIDDPAKSINPLSANHAPSPYHCHPPEIGYMIAVMKIVKIIYVEYLVLPATAPETIVAAVAAKTN